MRGGLDDALEKLARRDELRRRAAGEAPGTPPAVTELVEAVAAVVARHPELGITMGVEGAGDPVLLHFADENGIVQVSADNTVASRVAQAAQPPPRHADFDIELDPVEDLYPEQPARQPFDANPRRAADPEERFTDDGGPDLNRQPYRYDAARQYQATGSYEPTPYDSVSDTYYTRSDAYASSSGGYDPVAAEHDDIYGSERRGQHQYTAPAQHAQPAPVRPASAPPAAAQPGPAPAQPTTAQPTTAQPRPLPEPVPLRVDSGATELAAKRLAALLRENPSLLRPAPLD